MREKDAPISKLPGDAELLAEFAEHRREAAFAEVVRRHGGMVLAVCRSVLRDGADAEDAAQAVFLTLAHKAHKASVRTHLVGWLHRVAWYVAARGAKARAIRRRHEQEAARMQEEIRTPAGAPAELEALHGGLAKLPEKYRVAMILHHVEGRSQEETAAFVGCSVEAVAVRLHRGREMLRKRLSRTGLAAAAVAAVGWEKMAAGPATAGFVVRTSHAACAVLAGSVEAAAVSGPALALSKRAMGMLFWGRVRTAAALVMLLLLVAGIFGLMLASREGHGPAKVQAAAVPRAQRVVGNGISGRISAVEIGSVAIQPQVGQAVTVTLNAGTVISVNDTRATVGDLKVGMMAGALFQPGQPAAEVRAYTAVTPAN